MKPTNQSKKIRLLTTWDVWTYDVWGNHEDGFDVNDRCCIARNYELAIPIETHNAGTPHEFRSASPTDRQIKKALGVLGAIETEGSDVMITVSLAKNGRPIGELICTSHENLSPIKKVKP